MSGEDDELDAIDAYWRAANYLTVGQFYLLANPLLREPLRTEHIKPRLLGHWGTSPGLNLIYAHLNRVIRRRAVIAHLGSGASMVALCDGRSVETTMGFSPAGGLVMSTRSGDLDPALMVYLLDHGHDARSVERLIHHEAGLHALSETTSDMRRLLAARAADPRAALAVDAFCYHARKAVGALAAVLGGIDTLVFTGGIGQHAAEVRGEICRGLAHLGIALDDARNAAGAPIVSTGRCEVRVMATDEEREIARATRRVLGGAV
ncbi:MAG TPA: hypothetical protein VFK02_20875 [Kofleriaceae bacterium]|nr:hypothetical protein [Kofleriaceae bacterium]